MPDEFVNIRYMVDDVERAVGFYTTHFGFTLRNSAARAFAEVERLRSAGVKFRNDIITGPGGRQILPATRSSSSSRPPLTPPGSREMRVPAPPRRSETRSRYGHDRIGPPSSRRRRSR